MTRPVVNTMQEMKDSPNRSSLTDGFNGRRK